MCCIKFKAWHAQKYNLWLSTAGYLSHNPNLNPNLNPKLSVSDSVTLHFLGEIHKDGNGHSDGSGTGISRAFPYPCYLANTGFPSLWDLASIGFLIGFSVSRTHMASTGFLIVCGFPEYWFSYRWIFLWLLV